MRKIALALVLSLVSIPLFVLAADFAAVLLIAIGVLILTRHFTLLSGYLSFLNRFAL